MTPPKQIAGKIEDRDYPKDAMKAEVSGTSGSRINIDTEGRVTSCESLISAGSTVLDMRACELIAERFVYEPARDDKSQPIAAVRSVFIYWLLPPKPEFMRFADIAFTVKAMLAEIRRVSVTLIVLADADGGITACQVEKPSGIVALDKVACEAVAAGPPLTPARSADGKTIRALHQLVVAFTGPRGAIKPK